MNIRMAIRILPVTVRSGVIPVDSPTVAKALIASKRTSRSGFCSVLNRSKAKADTVPMESTSTVRAFWTVSHGNVRLNTSTCSRRLRLVLTAVQRTAAVVVLMPPPVEPGEAPTNMQIIIRNRLADDSRPMSQVLKPAVRVVTDWKIEIQPARAPGTPRRSACRSNTKSSSAPVPISSRLITRTILVCTRNRNRWWPGVDSFALTFTARSWYTVNPSPPHTMRRQMLTFVRACPSNRTKLSLKVEKPALQKAETA